MNKTITITKHTDPGHGWYAVKRDVLLSLGVECIITDYSYQSRAGTTVYLEEDLDATTFFRAAEKAGLTVVVNESYKDRSPVRSYPRFKAVTNG